MCVVRVKMLLLAGAGRLPSSSAGVSAGAARASRSPVRPAGSGVNGRPVRAVLPAVCMCTGVVSSSEGVFWCILDVDERTTAELLELLITVRISTSVSFAASPGRAAGRPRPVTLEQAARLMISGLWPNE